MPVVNLFVIGVRKAGTSWLYYLLDQHPEIFMSRVKELYFFGAHYPEGVDEYHRHFPFEQDYTYFGEATVSYFRRADVAREIEAYSPDAKVLAIVRDPVERLLSQFWYHKQLGYQPEAATVRDVLTDSPSKLVDDSHYERTLPAYRAIFGDDQFRIVSLEEATANPAACWEGLQRFLELDPVLLADPAEQPQNPTGSAAFRRLYRGVVRPMKDRYPGLYERLLASPLVHRTKQVLLRLLGTAEKRQPPAAVLAELRREFAPTYAYLDRLGFTAYQEVASHGADAAGSGR